MSIEVRKIKGLSIWRSNKKLDVYPEQKKRVEEEGYVSLGDRIAVLTQTKGLRQPPPAAYQYNGEPDSYEAINAHRLDPVDIEHNKQIIENRYKSAIDEMHRIEREQKARIEALEAAQEAAAQETESEPVITEETATGEPSV